MSRRRLLPFLLIACVIGLTMEVDAGKSPGSPGKNRAKHHGKKSPGHKNKGAASSIESVANNLRLMIGRSAVGRLSGATIEYENAVTKLREADAELTRVLRQVETQKAANRVDVTERAARTRDESIQAEKDYATAMLRVRNHLRNGPQYRLLQSKLEAARQQYDEKKRTTGESSETFAALGEVVQLEGQIKEIEDDALAADKEASDAREAHENLKQAYQESRRELYLSGFQNGNNRTEITLAYQSVEAARREVAAKERTLQQIKALIRAATFKKPVWNIK